MVINQFAAIGDILFIEPICRHIWNVTDKKPILPVRDHLMWFADHINSAIFTPMSKFSLDYESMEISNPDYLPLRFANQIMRNLDKHDHSDFTNTMPDKYLLAEEFFKMHNMPSMKHTISSLNKSWSNVLWHFNFDKSADLFIALNLSSDEEFIFVNEHSQAGSIKINPENPNNLRIVRMEVIPGFNVLDWTPIMLLAKEHHHVSTCTFYMLEGMKAIHDAEIPITIYPRPNKDGLQGISKLNPSFKYKIGVPCE